MMRGAPRVWVVFRCLALALGLAASRLSVPVVACAEGATTDTLVFEPTRGGATGSVARAIDHDDRSESGGGIRWVQPPFLNPLSGSREDWPVRHPFRDSNLGLALDYNRVDELRPGLTWQVQGGSSLSPRLGLRVEYTTARATWLYGAQLEQPLDPGNHLAAGFSLYRRTEHGELQMFTDLENSLALLFARQDFRDYFEREGFDGYLALRWTGVTTLSVHSRNDQFRSLSTYGKTSSWFHQNRELRENPAIDDGEGHALAVRLERMRPGRPGFHHWIEFETAGGSLGGDFDYRRLLGDLRSVVRLSPAATVTLRGVAGSGLTGTLPRQRTFTAGGVDALRAHSFAEFQGDQIALGQAEYSAGIGRVHAGQFESGLHVLAFVDAGKAWTNPSHDWDPRGQRMAVDGGFGLATAEDNLRIYFAKNLQEPSSDILISARFQRPF
jgi:hypothetical protein